MQPSSRIVFVALVVLGLLLPAVAVAQDPQAPQGSSDSALLNPGRPDLTMPDCENCGDDCASVCTTGTVSNDLMAIPLTIDSELGPATRTSIAIPDALNLGMGDPDGIAQRIHRTLRRDLELAGHFMILTPESYHFDQHADGMSESTVNYTAWSQIGATALAKTSFRTAGGQVHLDFRLFRVTPGGQIALDWEPRTVSNGGVEAAVHDFANQIVLYFTGSRGPFGTRIAFAARGEAGSREIYTMQIGTGNVSPITDDRDLNMLPRWAGRNIVYTSYVAGNPDLVMYTPPRGDEEEPSVRTVSNRPGLNMGGDLSPDGETMVIALSFDGQSEIYLINVNDGEIIARLTDDLTEDVSPVFSPDGSRIAFVSDRSGGPQIYVMRRDGSGQRRVTFAGRYNTTPEWSPDGALIAFTGRDSHNRFDIFTVEVGTSFITRLTQDQGNNESPSWSPDGQFLVFASTRGAGEPRLYMMTHDGLFQTLLTPNGSGYLSPVWQH